MLKAHKAIVNVFLAIQNVLVASLIVIRAYYFAIQISLNL